MSSRPLSRAIPVLLAIIGIGMALPAFGQQLPPCKALDRWEERNDYWRESAWPVPYKRRTAEGRAVVYNYDHLIDGEGMQVYSDRYYAIPDFKAMAYKEGNGHDFSFKQRAEVRLRCRLAVRNKRDKKVTKFLKKKRFEGLAMDIFVTMKSVDGMPVYRLGVRPLNFDLADYPALRYAHVNLQQFGSRNMLRFVATSRSDWFFSFAMPDTEGQRQGELRFSDWQFCEPCMVRYITSGNAPRDVMPVNPRQRTRFRMNDWASAQVYPLGRLNGLAEGAPAYIPTEVGLRPIEYSLAETPHDWVEIRFGKDAIESAASLAWRYDQAKRRNREYTNLIASAFTPLTVETHMKTAGCPKVRNPSWGEGANEQIRAGNEALRRADCLSEHLAKYDPVPLVSIYDELVAEEALLYAETLALERVRLPTAEQQFNAELHSIERLVNRANQYFEKANYIERRSAKARAARAAKRAAMQSAFISTQQQINSMQADVAQMQRDNEAFAALEIQKQRRRQWEREREIAMQARAQSVAAAREQLPAKSASSPAGSARAPAYEGFDRVPETPAVSLPCADIPTPGEVRRLRAGESIPGFDAGWERCVENDAATAGASDTRAMTSMTPATETPRGAGSSGGTSQAAAAAEVGHTDAIGASDSTGGSGPNGDASGVAATDGTSTDHTGAGESTSRGARYVFVRDLDFEHRGFAFSTEQQAVDGLKGAWADGALSRYCSKAWAGADAYRGVVSVKDLALEQVSSSRWTGAARLDGYCRLLAHDADYDRVPACPAERRGQPNCYVLDRYLPD